MISPMRLLRFIQDLRSNAVPVSSRYNIPVWKIAVEQTLLYWCNRLRRDEYYRYHLFDASMTWKQKRAFISDLEMRKIQHALTPHVYIGLLKNKMAFHHYFRSFNIPLPDLIAVFDPEHEWECGTPCLRNASDIEIWLKRYSSDVGFVFKPIEGDGGQSILVCRCQGPVAGSLCSADGRILGAEALDTFMTSPEIVSKAYDGGQMLSAYIIERLIDQHPAVSELSPDTVCTLRVVTLFRNGAPEIMSTVFKLPTSSCGIDNLHAGGLGVGVDDQGVLQRGRSLQDMWLPYRSALPNGKQFEGFQLPYWQEILEVAKCAASAFPYVPAIGWDIAISRGGPVVIEGNWGWGADVIQIGNHEGIMCKSLADLYGKPTRALPE